MNKKLKIHFSPIGGSQETLVHESESIGEDTAELIDKLIHKQKPRSASMTNAALKEFLKTL